MGVRALVLAALIAGAASGDEMLTADEAIDLDFCERMVAELTPRVEKYARLRFRGGLTIEVETREAFAARLRAGNAAVRGTAAYVDTRGRKLTIVPWAFNRGFQAVMPRAEWRARLEPMVIPLLARVILLQNFPPRDRTVVDALASRGFCRLVALQTVKDREQVTIRPAFRLEEPQDYLVRYRSGDAFLHVLQRTDGLDLMYHLTSSGGTRGLRAVLYRPPPLELFVRPELLTPDALDDPPDPDAIFRFLAPDAVPTNRVRMSDRPLEMLRVDAPRDTDFLAGWIVELASARYAFYVTDPDRPAPRWLDAQIRRLRRLADTIETRPNLPYARGVKADLVVARRYGVFMRASVGGLVVLAQETRPTPNLEGRVLRALRTLYIRRPRPRPYDALLAKLRRDG